MRRLKTGDQALEHCQTGRPSTPQNEPQTRGPVARNLLIGLGAGGRAPSFFFKTARRKITKQAGARRARGGGRRAGGPARRARRARRRGARRRAAVVPRRVLFPGVPDRSASTPSLRYTQVPRPRPGRRAPLRRRRRAPERAARRVVRRGRPVRSRRPSTRLDSIDATPAQGTGAGVRLRAVPPRRRRVPRLPAGRRPAAGRAVCFPCPLTPSTRCFREPHRRAVASRLVPNP